MNREWKPGDVAMIPFLRGEERAFWTANGWVTHDFPDVQNRTYYAPRPLAVIDPEDREAVERLLANYHGWKWENATQQPSITDMQAALREYANPKPPKPDEPQGLGAVVEDEDGNRFVLCESPGGGRHWYGADKRGGQWDLIAAVRVLSPGVEVDQ